MCCGESELCSHVCSTAAQPSAASSILLSSAAETESGRQHRFGGCLHCGCIVSGGVQMQHDARSRGREGSQLTREARWTWLRASDVTCGARAVQSEGSEVEGSSTNVCSARRRNVQSISLLTTRSGSRRGPRDERGPKPQWSSRLTPASPLRVYGSPQQRPSPPRCAVCTVRQRGRTEAAQSFVERAVIAIAPARVECSAHSMSDLMQHAHWIRGRHSTERSEHHCTKATVVATAARSGRSSERSHALHSSSSEART